ncbi:hypothetical protein AGRA3207_007616 [Actinomadura graeca]|uniref:Uncharacterized protein n=1 Tax=Actinomadura graeca TaxID=2750812 RepID=A0ABX8R6I0_9ACTN|nr:hypothetical protein [Actinomadura graeca]QXJ26029.1 hypothetical protein AGRA3207_007616 [Actinomadura graeca]
MAAQITRGDFGVHQFAGHLGLSRWQLRVGREHGLVPPPDREGERWSARLVEEASGNGATVIAMFGDEPPIGSARAAARLASRVGLDVERGDVEVLVAQGDLNVISHFRGYPVYLIRDLDRLDPESVRRVVSARKGPLLDSVDASGAAMILDWPRRSFDSIAGELELPVDQLGRYALDDIRALAEDENLARRVVEEKRRLALARTRQTETRIEDVVRSWLLQCMAYVDRTADQPPDPGAAGRAIRALVTARAETARQERGET